MKMTEKPRLLMMVSDLHPLLRLKVLSVIRVCKTWNYQMVIIIQRNVLGALWFVSYKMLWFLFTGTIRDNTGLGTIKWST